MLPEGFCEISLRLAHETLMSGQMGIKKTLDRAVSEFFCFVLFVYFFFFFYVFFFFFFFFFFGQVFVVMWLEFLNLATFVRELFSKVVSLRYL